MTFFRLWAQGFQRSATGNTVDKIIITRPDPRSFISYPSLQSGFPFFRGNKAYQRKTTAHDLMITARCTPKVNST